MRTFLLATDTTDWAVIQPKLPRKASRRAEIINECFGGDNRPIFLNSAIDESLDVARVTGALYYLSAGFLTVRGCDSSSH